MSQPSQRKEPPERYVPERTTGFAIIERARAGVGTQRADQLAQFLALSLKEMAGLLQIAERIPN